MKHIVHAAGNEKELGHVLAYEPEVGIVRQMFDVCHVAGDQVVDSDDRNSLLEQSIGEMGAKKAGAAGDYCCRFGRIRHEERRIAVAATSESS